jgi:hypothetical protein
MYFTANNDNTRHMRLLSTGNLGINVDTPTERLHVGGNAIITGALSAGGYPVKQDTIYTPIYAATTTIAITSTQAVYLATYGTAGAVTQSIAGLTVSAAQEARWELWINATNPAALAPTWQGNLDWQYGTPDMTVTGLYKFAMSTTGGRIRGRQTWPTVHPWSVMEMAAAYSGPWSLDYAGASNALAFYRGHRYQDNVIVEIGVLAGGDGSVSAKSIFATGSDGVTSDSGMTATVLITTGYPSIRMAFPARTSVIDTPQIIIRARAATLSAATRLCLAYHRKMNELETAAYAAGWRP